jgi:hypothetical protein
MCAVFYQLLSMEKHFTYNATLKKITLCAEKQVIV